MVSDIPHYLLVRGCSISLFSPLHAGQKPTMGVRGILIPGPRYHLFSLPSKVGKSKGPPMECAGTCSDIETFAHSDPSCVAKCPSIVDRWSLASNFGITSRGSLLAQRPIESLLTSHLVFRTMNWPAMLAAHIGLADLGPPIFQDVSDGWLRCSRSLHSLTTPFTAVKDLQ